MSDMKSEEKLHKRPQGQYAIAASKRWEMENLDKRKYERMNTFLKIT